MEASELLVASTEDQLAAECRKTTLDTYEELLKAYDFFNQHLFEGSLPGCVLTFQRNKRTLGYFSNNRFVHKDGVKADEIALNPAAFAVSPIESVLSTLVHEQVHQWQAKFGKPTRRRYHNSEWAERMQSIGLIPSDTGRPGGKKVGESMDHFIHPDGRFLALARDLIGSGFGLSWYDRYPMVADMPIYIGPDIVQAPEQLPKSATDIVITGLFDEPPIPAEEIAPTFLVSRPTSSNLEGLQLPSPETKTVQTRGKFVCTGCGAAAWGKPSLKVICAPCNLPMPRVG